MDIIDEDSFPLPPLFDDEEESPNLTVHDNAGTVNLSIAINLQKHDVLVFAQYQGGHGTGKTWNLVITFTDRENTGNLAATQGNFGQPREFSKFP